MLVIGKTKSEYFRKDYSKCSRRPLLDISDAQEYTTNILNVARYAPSACNSQPWFLEYCDNRVYLYRTCGKKVIQVITKED